MKKNVLAGDAKQIERKIIFYNFKGGNKMKKRQALSAVLATAMVASLGMTAAAATDVAANDLAYKGELEIMHYSTSEESEGMNKKKRPRSRTRRRGSYPNCGHR